MPFFKYSNNSNVLFYVQPINIQNLHYNVNKEITTAVISFDFYIEFFFGLRVRLIDGFLAFLGKPCAIVGNAFSVSQVG